MKIVKRLTKIFCANVAAQMDKMIVVQAPKACLMKAPGSGPVSFLIFSLAAEGSASGPAVKAGGKGLLAVFIIFIFAPQLDY